MTGWLLLVALAFGQDPAPEPPSEVPEDSDTGAPEDTDLPDADTDTEATDTDLDATAIEGGMREDGVYEVRVHGPDAIRESRNSVVEAMRSQGWRHTTSKDGDYIFRGPRNWLGKATLTREGSLLFTIPAISYDSAQGTRTFVTEQGPTDQSEIARSGPGGDYQAVSRDDPSGAVASVGFKLFPSKRKVGAFHDAVAAAVEPQLAVYRSAVQETAFQESLEALPGSLDALWLEGTPLEGGDPLDSLAQRRQAALAYWASRADTPQGMDVCRAVEVWLSETVQSSDDPVTPDEQQAANASAQHGRTLDLPMP